MTKQEKENRRDILLLERSGYLPRRHDRVAYECGRRGVTKTKEIAAICNVKPQAIRMWLRQRLSFRAHYLKGIDAASLNVEQALVKRALGYNVRQTEVRRESGVNGVTKVVTKKVMHVPADVQAQKFFLKNRQVGRWNREKSVPTKSMNLDIRLDASDKEV